MNLIRLVWLIGMLGTMMAGAADRTPWNSSRVVGAPEPPPPYLFERVLTEGRIENATELDFVPGSTWALILDQRGNVHGVDRSRPGPPRRVGELLPAVGREGEAYSLAFDPGFATNRWVYAALWASGARPQEMRIVRFNFEPGDPPGINPDSAQTIIAWPSNGHNGCDVQFGPDGMLYFSAGDSASPVPPDPHETGQKLDDLLSSIMRIDVRGGAGNEGYAIPPDNPFVGRSGIRPEIWAYGFRNPWKMSFDPGDGALWVGDVGWELWEQVFRIDHGGFNGGWSVVEGPQSIHPAWPLGPTPIEKPVVSHSHIEATSITGGLVYRGSRLPELQGAYVYGDWAMGRIWALWWRDGGVVRRQELAITPHQIVGFAEDGQLELYYLDYRDGSVYQLKPNPVQGDGSRFPRTLGDTGLFVSTEGHQLAPGVEPFSIAAPMWNDHASAVRAVAFPGESRARWKNDYLESPTNAVLLRTLSMEMTAGNPETARRIETQLLHFDGLVWRGYSYKWRDDQTDADLVDRDGGEAVLQVVDPRAPGGRREQRWRFHSRAECTRCHMVRVAEMHGNLNAFEPHQLASLKHANGRTELDRLTGLGLIEPGPAAAQYELLVDPRDGAAPLESRARSYLHANCAHCHRPDAGGAVQMYWPVAFDLERTRGMDLKPARGDFGMADARILKPGHPEGSALIYRLLTTGAGRMPIIGSSEVDDGGLQILTAWVKSRKSGDFNQPIPAAGFGDTSYAVSAALALGARAPEDWKTDVIRDALESTNAAVRGLFERFLPAEKRRRVLGSGFPVQSVLALRGDAARGRTLFFSAGGPQCYTCHQVDGDGRAYGPSLVGVGNKYTREQLLEHITRPNLLVDEAWRARVIETGDGETVTGFIDPGEEQVVRLRVATGEQLTIPRTEVRSLTIQQTSLMPEGLLDALTAQEAADLLEFLARAP